LSGRCGSAAAGRPDRIGHGGGGLLITGSEDSAAKPANHSGDR
jgi:hypothetical protein